MPIFWADKEFIMKKLAGLLAVMILTLSMACLFTSCSNKIKVSFVQDGQTTIVKTIDKGQTLTDIPAPVQKTGYTVSWEVADFSNLQKDLTVNAVETPNVYTITYEIQYFATIENTTQSVVFGKDFTLQTPSISGEYADIFNLKFDGWTIKGQDKSLSDGVYDIASNLILIANWVPAGSGEWSPNA